jgi:hypothetical protein
MTGLFFKMVDLAGCWWLMPIIVAIQEAQIGGSRLKANLSKKFTRPVFTEKAEHGGKHLSSQILKEAEIGLWSRLAQEKNKTPSPKLPEHKRLRGGGV